RVDARERACDALQQGRANAGAALRRRRVAAHADEGVGPVEHRRLPQLRRQVQRQVVSRVLDHLRLQAGVGVVVRALVGVDAASSSAISEPSEWPTAMTRLQAVPSAPDRSAATTWWTT